MRTLSIALLMLTSISFVHTPMHAEAPQVASQETENLAYIKGFFSGSNNFDEGYTVAGLNGSVTSELTNDANLLQAWNAIDIRNNPDAAVDFLLERTPGIASVISGRDDACCMLRETIIWEFIDTLLFGQDQQTLNTYTWDQIVDYVRSIAHNTQIQDITKELPKKDEFQNRATNFIAVARVSEVHEKLNKHIHRFPQKLQAKGNDKRMETRAQSRMQHVLK